MENMPTSQKLQNEDKAPLPALLTSTPCLTSADIPIKPVAPSDTSPCGTGEPQRHGFPSVGEHLFVSRTFLDFRSTTDGAPRLGLRRVRSTGDLPSVSSWSVCEKEGQVPEVAQQSLGPEMCGQPDPAATKPPPSSGNARQSGRTGKARRNKKHNTTADVPRVTHHTQDALKLQMIQALKEARNAETVLVIFGQNQVDFDFDLCVAALHAAAKLEVPNPSQCVSSSLFHSLVQQIRHGLQGACARASGESCHFLTDILYAFAKLEVTGFPAIVHDVCTAMPAVLSHCSPVELSTSLWSLARLAGADVPNTDAAAQAQQLASQIMAQIAHRPLARLTPHCMSEIMYARARLDLQGKAAQHFMDACRTEICRRSSLQDFSTQGLANMSWALAKSHSFRAAASQNATGEASLKIIRESRDRLPLFEMLELSMTTWAVAKLHARSEGGLRPEAMQEVCAFILGVAEESVNRFCLMSAQSISNVAWALTKLDCMADSRSWSFFEKAMAALIEKPGEFAPQAISNLCYAVSWLNSKSRGRVHSKFRETMLTFGEIAAFQALSRESEFKWQDLSGVLVAIGPRFPNDDTPIGQGCCTKQLAERLAERVTYQGHQLTTQVGLNIAVAAARTGLESATLRQLTSTMSSVIASRTPRVNGHDLRQFKELREHCQFASQ